MKRLLPILLVLCNACGVTIPMTHSIDKLGQLSQGMDRSAVVSTLGKPQEVPVLGEQVNDTAIQVDEYDLFQKHAALWDVILGPITLTLTWWYPSPRHMNSYWVQYLDGKLARWGKAQSWKPESLAGGTLAPGKK